MEIWYLFVENYAVCFIIIQQITLAVVPFLLKSAPASYSYKIGTWQNALKQYINT
jgi:hypothetical protein